MKAAVCTIITRNYLAHARVLMDSVARFHPEFRRIVVLADRLDGAFIPLDEPFETILSEDLRVPDSRRFHFKYSLVELCTALKPFALEHIMAQMGVPTVIFLDADTRIYARLDAALRLLSESAIVITPHLTAPIHDGCYPGELEVLRVGTYNLGFLAIRNSSVGLEFLRWWRNRLLDFCRVDIEHGLYVDQRWMDLAPSLFEDVRVLRDPGYNVAYWNLAERMIETRAGAHFVNGQPLVFFHFSGCPGAEGEGQLEHQNRFDNKDLEAVRDIINGYCRALQSAGFDSVSCLPSAYAHFEDGTPIPDAARHSYAAELESSAPDIDPFSAESMKRFQAIWNSLLTSSPGATPPRNNDSHVRLTRLALKIYESRLDVKKRFPPVDGSSGRRVLAWLLTYGRLEHRLSGTVMRPLENEWDRVQRGTPVVRRLLWRLRLTAQELACRLRRAANNRRRELL